MKILLDAFEKAGKDIEYFALDLSYRELNRTLSAVHGRYNHVRCFGLHGMYEDGLAWLKNTGGHGRPRCVLWLGSSIGNLSPAGAAAFLRQAATVLKKGDGMLIGIDACQDADKVYTAYNDRAGKTREFYLNGLAHANKLLGTEVFKEAEWDVSGEYDAQANRHQAFYWPKTDLVVDGTVILKGTRIKFEESYKYSLLQSAKLWQVAGFLSSAEFSNSEDLYRK